MIGQLGRIAGKSFISGLKGTNYAGRIAGKKAVGKGARLIAGTGQYAGQMAKGLTDPMMVSSLAMSYVPMMMMSGDQQPVGGMEYETMAAMAPKQPEQQNYSASNILQPGPDDLARQQMLDMNGYYGG